jgi:hypothetical protein
VLGWAWRHGQRGNDLVCFETETARAGNAMRWRPPAVAAFMHTSTRMPTHNLIVAEKIWGLQRGRSALINRSSEWPQRCVAERKAKRRLA